MNAITSTELKAMITKYGRCNINNTSVVRIGENGSMSFAYNPKSRLEDNEISLHECTYHFSGNFNDNAIESIMPELNSLIKSSRIDHFEGLLDMVSGIINKQK